jgi:DNA-binding MarR family transcriptional regulator
MMSTQQTTTEQQKTGKFSDFVNGRHGTNIRENGDKIPLTFKQARMLKYLGYDNDPTAEGLTIKTASDLIKSLLQKKNTETN